MFLPNFYSIDEVAYATGRTSRKFHILSYGIFTVSTPAAPITDGAFYVNSICPAYLPN